VAEPKVAHDPDAEHIILGNCFLQSSADPLGNLGEHEFFSEHNRKVYRAIVGIAAQKLPINITEVGRWIVDHRNGVPIPYLTALIDGVPEHADLSVYRGRIRDTAAERLALHEAWELGEAAKHGAPAAEVIKRAGRLAARAKPADAKPAVPETFYPVVPKEAWHGLSKLYHQAWSDATESSDNYVFASFIVAMAALLGRFVHIRLGRIVYPNLFVVLVGKSGRSRKDTAVDPAIEFCQAIDPDVYLTETVDSREGFIEELAVAQKQQQQAKLFGALRFIIRLPELRTLLEKAAQKGARNIMPTMSAVYDCRPKLEVKTRSNPATVTEPTGSLVAGTDPEWLEDLTAADIKAAIGRRVLFIPGDRKFRKANLPDPDSETLNALKVKIREAVDYWRARGTTRLQWSGEAAKRWAHFYEVELDRRDDDEIIAVLGEGDHVTCAKLATIWAALDKSEYIETFHLDAAIAFTEFLYEARFPIFKGHGLAPLARLDQKIVEIVKTAPAGQITWKPLRKKLWRIDIELFEKRMNWLTREDGPLSVSRLGKTRIVRAEE